MSRDPVKRVTYLPGIRHHEAFGCSCFRNIIETLIGAGYRVVAPGHIGWGKPAKPGIPYSSQQPRPGEEGWFT
jgi:hypothetical protein